MSCFSCFSNQEKKVPRRPNNNNSSNNGKRIQYAPTQISPKKAPQPNHHHHQGKINYIYIIYKDYLYHPHQFNFYSNKFYIKS